MNSLESFDQSSFHQSAVLYEGIGDFNIDTELNHLFQNFTAAFPKQSSNMESPLKAFKKSKKQRQVSLLSTASTVGHSRENNISPQISSKEPKTPKKDKTSPKKVWRTSKMKNHQGFLAARIKKMCEKIEKTGKETNLFQTATVFLTQERKKDFLKWVSTYHKSYKTWNKLKEFMSSEPEFGVIFAEMIMFLLTDLFKDEFEKVLKEGRVRADNKALLEEQKSKNFYAWKFTLIRDDLLGGGTNFDVEINKPREGPKKKLKT